MGPRKWSNILKREKIRHLLGSSLLLIFIKWNEIFESIHTTYVSVFTPINVRLFSLLSILSTIVGLWGYQLISLPSFWSWTSADAFPVQLSGTIYAGNAGQTLSAGIRIILELLFRHSGPHPVFNFHRSTMKIFSQVWGGYSHFHPWFWSLRFSPGILPVFSAHRSNLPAFHFFSWLYDYQGCLSKN